MTTPNEITQGVINGVTVGKCPSQDTNIDITAQEHLRVAPCTAPLSLNFYCFYTPKLCSQKSNVVNFMGDQTVTKTFYTRKMKLAYLIGLLFSRILQFTIGII